MDKKELDQLDWSLIHAMSLGFPVPIIARGFGVGLHVVNSRMTRAKRIFGARTRMHMLALYLRGDLR